MAYFKIILHRWEFSTQVYLCSKCLYIIHCGQKRALNSLELESQTIPSQQMHSGNWSPDFRRVASAVRHWGISLSPHASEVIMKILCWLFLKLFSSWLILTVDDLNIKHKFKSVISGKLGKILHLLGVSETLVRFEN